MRPHTKEFLQQAIAPFGAYIVENTWMPATLYCWYMFLI